MGANLKGQVFDLWELKGQIFGLCIKSDDIL